ncbi:MAG: beta-xylosidase, partial [Verrucomicrobia bacterium GWC2_42_7]
MNNFSIDLSLPTTPFKHYWEKCVGSCHAATALRSDWQSQLKKCHDELGFEYVRFHGLFNDDMSVLAANNDGQLEYSFYNIDLIYDFLLSIGMKPFVELGFMPTVIASGPQTLFHYKSNVTPPKDYDQWATLVYTFVKHLVDRYGKQEVKSWFFEVWNEPNLEAFWPASQAEYFKLYKYSAEAVKKVDAAIPVGGPATARNAWIPEMIQFCQTNHVALDFISTHQYPTDVCLGLAQDMESQMASAKPGVLTQWVHKAKTEAGNYPLYYTEWNNSPASRDPYHDDPYCAAFCLKTIADNAGLLDIYSFWTFSDIFEEMSLSSVPFHGDFGLLNIHGIPKPVYRAFELLHNCGNERFKVEHENSSTVEVLAAGDNKTLNIIIYNHNVPLAPLQTELVKIQIKGLKHINSSTVERIDDTNANAKSQWTKIGKPVYLG